jgi:hypothetical protein
LTFKISILGKQIHLKKIDKVGLAKDTGKAREQINPVYKIILNRL